MTRPHLAIVALVTSIGLAIAATAPARADSTPITSLPRGPVTRTTTRPGLLVAVALPRASSTSGLTWRLARRYDSRIVRQISEADVGTSVVLVFKVVGRGDTALVLGLTRGDTSPIAIKVQTYRIHST
jgi:hypothetical protein